MTREEAIEVIKRNCRLDSDLRKSCELFIPELTENEDERIRKALIQYLKDYPCNLPNGLYSRDDFFTYLEKQKEQKSAEWSEEEKDKLNSIERLIVNANAHGNYLIGDKEAIDLQHFIRSIVKPTTNIAEWSEEDEKNLELVTDCVYEFYPDPVIKYKLKDWLKSLPERFTLQPKQEWSEEDEKTINDACCWLAEYSGYLMKNYGKASMLMRLTNKLKSLRPKPYTVSTKDTIKFGNLEYERCVKDGIQSEKNPSLEAERGAD